MNTNDAIHERKGESKGGKGLKGLLFFANWLFIVFLSKKFISPPGGNLDFVLKNTGTLFIAVVMTALMNLFFPRKAVMVLIPIMVLLAVIMAMT